MISPCAGDGSKHSYNEGVEGRPHPLLPDGADGDVEPERKRVKGGFVTRSLTRRLKETTNDEIHKRIKMCPVFKAIMDTPQVQRLRGLKQLATADLVYANANHTRFEHSLGVAHLADKLCSHLQEDQPNLKITDKDRLCVKLAGLCHDLGHGPYSHVFETLVNKEIKKYLKKNPDLLKQYEGLPDAPIDINDPKSEWAHEDASLMMLDAALESLGLAIDMNNLDKPLMQVGDGIKPESMRLYKNVEDSETFDPECVLTSRDFVFIKEMIIHKPINNKSPADEVRSGFVGRPDRRQEFLYDIVANRHNGLDVDKMDYFARDCGRTMGSQDVDVRLVDEAVVAWGECPKPGDCHACSPDNRRKHLMICYPEKVRRQARDFFQKRFDFHSEIYKHKTSSAATFMICDILTKADAFFRIPTFMESERGVKSDCSAKELPISRAMLEPGSYLRLQDAVIDQIMATTSHNLRPARLLIEQLRKRNLYGCAGEKQIKSSNAFDTELWEKSEDEIAKEIMFFKGEHENELGCPVYLDREDFIVEKSTIHHGAKEADPVENMRFLPKNSNEEKLLGPIEDLPVAIAITGGLEGSKSESMQEQRIRFYCRGGKDKLDLLRHIVAAWKSEYESERMMTEEVGSNSDSDENEQHESARLATQEEDESSVGRTPQRNGRNDSDDEEPSPFPLSHMR